MAARRGLYLLSLLWALGLLRGGSGMAVACETWKEGGRMGAYGGGAGVGLRVSTVLEENKAPRKYVDAQP